MRHNEADYDSLRQKYKNFFENMTWGFECGPGWYKIIEKLTDDIHAIMARDNLDTVATTVKEKYGTLRFYLSSTPKEIQDLIKKATKETETTCERCGEPGQISHNGCWVKVRCKTCI